MVVCDWSVEFLATISQLISAAGSSGLTRVHFVSIFGVLWFQVQFLYFQDFVFCRDPLRLRISHRILGISGLILIRLLGSSLAEHLVGRLVLHLGCTEIK